MAELARKHVQKKVVASTDRRPLTARGLIDTYIGSKRTDPLEREDHLSSLLEFYRLKETGEDTARANLIRERLIETTTRRVTRMIGKLGETDSRVRKFPVEELIGVGAEALIKAVDNYKPDLKDDNGRSLSLLPYADVCIKNRLLEYCGSNGTGVSVGRRTMKTTAEISNDPEKLANVLSKPSRAWTFAAASNARKPKSMSEPTIDGRTVGDRIIDNTGFGRVEASICSAARETAITGVKAVLEKLLNKREMAVLCLYHGVGSDSEEGLTFEKIGDRFGFTRAWAQVVYHKAIEKLQRSTNPRIIALRENWELANEVY